jgi:glycosyltransferase involved in cell wall biosynthesis
MKTSISAVVRTWNSGRTLAKTLVSLRIQSSAPSEIIIVDSGSTDRTREIADHYGCRWLDYPAEDAFNYSAALNLGIAAASGAEILIVSSHTVLLYRDIVETMRANLHQHGAAGVYCTHSRSNYPLLKRDDPMRGQAEVTRLNTFQGYNGLSNSCSLILRSCWEQHAFDPTMPSAEDQEWAHWFFQNTSKPTVVLYLNPHATIRKEARDRVVIATRLLPALRSWHAILGLFRGSAIGALQGRRQLAAKDIVIATELLKSRMRPLKYTSRY